MNNTNKSILKYCLNYIANLHNNKQPNLLINIYFIWSKIKLNLKLDISY